MKPARPAVRRGWYAAWPAGVVALAMSLNGCTQTIRVPASPTDAASGTGGGSPGDSGRGPSDAPVSAPAPDARPDPAPDARGRLDLAGPRGNCQELGEARLDVPAVVVALERSLSMTTRMGDQTRARVAASAIQQAVQQFDRSIAFGLELFPSPSGACLGAADACCAGFVKLTPRRGAAAAFDNALGCGPDETCGNDALPNVAPTSEALKACRLSYASTPAGRAPRYVLLVTDGNPECPMMADPCEAAVTQTSLLSGLEEVQTIVVGIGEDARSANCLAAVAEAGGDDRASRPDPIVVERPQDVAPAIAAVLARIAEEPCRLQLPSGAGFDLNLLVLNDSPLPRDANRQQGWDFEDSVRGRVVVFGSACAQLKASLGRVNVSVCRGP